MYALAFTPDLLPSAPVLAGSVDVRKTSQERPKVMERSPESLGFSPKAWTSAAEEARELIRIIAGPLNLGDSVKAVLARVARKTGLGDRRVRAIWNEEARAIRSEEMDRLRATAAQEPSHAITAGRAEAAALAAVLSRVLASDAQPHPHLAREDLAAARDLVRRLGLGDRPRTGGGPPG
ncbi:hypothetical protein [Enterovirga rhinocerotis]|uniref:hypothetical protein n=1 Tax=Enterovirga rhinocerotis TaxID=1339210 RepID=UPI00105E1158|nr:hypothetical protein [Enterovirga rhinocerotis]